MAESGYGLAGLGMGKVKSISPLPAYAGLRRFYSCVICNNRVPPFMPLTRHILVTISESLYTVYIRSNDEVINGTG
uniref:Uncharacterized protein n=1 Tax=Escherichia coli TaxID=562 RepID=Q2TU20_ECOLX|nr:hypothetical protein O2ColV99 [Escherichia coli]